MKILFGSLLLLSMSTTQGNSLDTANVHMNNVQVIGSHNSYKKAIDPALFKLYQLKDSVSASKIDYEHISITDQLNLGLLNLEIDIYADEKGGRFAHPKGLDWVKNQPDFDPEGKMKQPGFKVFHIVDLDFRSQFLTLVDGLKELRAWSKAHPDHNPVFITIEPKDGASSNPNATPTEQFTPALFDKLDKVMRETLGKDQIITPDMVRGKYKTLESAVLHNNWPTLKKAKGKFIFVLDDQGRKRAMYMAGHPSLKGRVLFANANAGTPEAAFMIINNPNNPEIPKLVKKGYIIRTRADADTKQARENDRSDFIAACNSGAQIITTDYYLRSTHFKSNYVVSFEGAHKYFRIININPLVVGNEKK